MVDLVQTPANVVNNTPGKNQETAIAGAAITAGMPLYRDSLDSNRAKPADADALASAEVVGIALCDAAAGQPVVYQVAGQINLGAALTIGQVYVVSATAGAIAPISDLASGDYVTILGVASSAALLDLAINASGVAKA